MDKGPMRTVGTNSTRVTIGWVLVLIAGLSVIVYGMTFMVNNFFGLVELGLEPDDVGLTPEQIGALPARLIAYITHAQFALGAFIAATGVAVSFFAFGIRAGEKSSWWGAIVTSLTWLILATAPHYVLGFADLDHLLPTYGYLVIFAIGAYLSYPAVK